MAKRETRFEKKKSINYINLMLNPFLGGSAMLSSFKKLFAVAWLCFVAIGVTSGSGFAQEGHYQILIADITPLNVERQLLVIPQTVSYSLNWELYERDKEGNYVEAPPNRMQKYEVICYEIVTDAQGNERRRNLVLKETYGENYTTFEGRTFAAKTGFKVRGFLRATDPDPEVESIEASIENAVEYRFSRFIGKIKGAIRYEEPTSYNIIIMVRQGIKAFVNSRFVGKLVFIALIITFLVWFRWGFSWLLWVLFSKPRSSHKKFHDQSVDDLIAGWKGIIDDARIIKPDKEYEILKDKELYIKESNYFNDPKKFESELDKDWHPELWGRKITKSIEKLLETTGNKAKNYPLGKIILAGIKNYQINKYHWYASQRVVMAMESMASAELEKLRSRTWLTWLWNVGAAAPLLGLLGTVTGISGAFWSLAMEVAQKGEMFTNVDMIDRLGPGISEALYTTIMGLIVGVMYLISHYSVKHKIDKIYSDWEDEVIEISEKL